MISSVFALALLVSSLFGQQAATQTEQPSLGFILCWDNESSHAYAQDRNILLAVGRAIGLTGVRTVRIKRESCGESARYLEGSCFGLPGGVICRLAAIRRIIRASAWLASQHFRGVDVIQYGAGRTSVTTKPNVVAAFQFADGSMSDEAAEHLVQQMLASEATPQQSIAIDEFDARKTAVYQAIVDFSVAALIGHEICHVMDEQCPLGQMSLVEESGLFNRMVASEMQGQLFCRKNSVVQELRADRCGLRHIRALKENLTARLEGANAKTVDFIQRAAADIVSFQLLLGWRKQAELTKGRYTFAALDAYLYGPLRALLFAAEINGKGPQPAICGESSELIVQAIQVTYRSCPSGGGIVSDEVLALFPKGVESSWNGAPWTAASHSCSAGK